MGIVLNERYSPSSIPLNSKHFRMGNFESAENSIKIEVKKEEANSHFICKGAGSEEERNVLMI